MSYNTIPINGFPQIKGIENVEKIPAVISDLSSLETVVNELLPTDYTPPTVTGDVSAIGGFFNVGNVVFLNMRLTNTGDAAATAVISGLPKYDGLTTTNIIVVTCVNLTSGAYSYVYLLNSGATGNISVPAGQALNIFAVYLSKEAVTRDTEPETNTTKSAKRTTKKEV